MTGAAGTPGARAAELLDLELWSKLPAESDVEEVIRNFFIRQPVLWVAPAAGA